MFTVVGSGLSAQAKFEVKKIENGARHGGTCLIPALDRGQPSQGNTQETTRGAFCLPSPQWGRCALSQLRSAVLIGHRYSKPVMHGTVFPTRKKAWLSPLTGILGCEPQKEGGNVF